VAGAPAEKDRISYRYRIAAGILLSATAWAAPATPPDVLEHLIFNHIFSEPTFGWQLLCLVSFWMGGVFVGTGWRHAACQRLLEQRDLVIGQLANEVGSYAQANQEFAEANQTLRAKCEEMGGTLAQRATEVTELYAALSQRPAPQSLPEEFRILTHAVFDRTIRVRLFPDHAGTATERKQREEMLMRWCRVLDYVRAHCRNGSSH
jgi:hypothetical protein